MLSSIEDPLRREQLQAELEMAAELEQDPIEMGGIFAVPGERSRQLVVTAHHERFRPGPDAEAHGAQPPEPEPAPEPGARLVRLVIRIVLWCIIVAAAGYAMSLLGGR